MPPSGGSPDWGIPCVPQPSPSAESMCVAEHARNFLRRSRCAAYGDEFFLYEKMGRRAIVPAEGTSEAGTEIPHPYTPKRRESKGTRPLGRGLGTASPRSSPFKPALRLRRGLGCFLPAGGFSAPKGAGGPIRHRAPRRRAPGSRPAPAPLRSGRYRAGRRPFGSSPPGGDPLPQPGSPRPGGGAPPRRPLPAPAGTPATPSIGGSAGAAPPQRRSPAPAGHSGAPGCSA